MAHSKSAKKRVKQNEKQRMHNKSEKTRMRNQARKVLKMIMHGEDAEKLKAEFEKTIKYYDMASKHGVIHRAQAGRRKSRLQLKYNDYLKKAAE